MTDRNSRPPSGGRKAELGPVRTGRETPSGDRPGTSSSSPMLPPDELDTNAKVQLMTKEPLPPISKVDHKETSLLEPPRPGQTTSEIIAGAKASSKAATGSRHPKNVMRHLVVDESDESSLDSDSSASSRTDSRRRRTRSVDGISAREVKTQRGSDGQEHTAISVNCQTEWSWLEDMRNYPHLQRKQGQLSKHSAPRTAHEAYEEEGSITSSEEVELNVAPRTSQTQKGQATGTISRSSRYSGSVAPFSPQVEIAEREASSLTLSAGEAASKTGVGDPQSASGLSLQGLQSEVSFISNPPLPTPDREDEYGIPILQLSTESEHGTPALLENKQEDWKSIRRQTSDSDSVYQYQARTAADAGTDDESEAPGTIPSIGPPQILQYKPESKTKNLEAEDPESRANLAEKRRKQLDAQGGGHARLRRKQGGSALEDGEEELGDGRLIADWQTGENQEEVEQTDSGMFAGTCEFCGNQIKPFPSMAQQKTHPPSELYCCEQYQEFVEFTVTHPLQEQKEKESERISVKPHAAYGSKQARKASRERAAQRMHERELSRHQLSQISMTGGSGGGGGGSGTGAGGAANFMQYARQMKTINYQLSSKKCLQEGWTLRPPSPVCDESQVHEFFEPEICHDGDPRNKNRLLVQKHYENGKLFVIMFPDGTGTVFYPSGHVAITISLSEGGIFTYIAQDDAEEDAAILAVFESNGCSTSYYLSGTIRVTLDQRGGIELDQQGVKKKKWWWKEAQHSLPHVHAPPIQPITFSLSSHLAVRIVNQDNIVLTYSCKTRGCRFQVGAKLKLFKPSSHSTLEATEADLVRQEVSAKVESIFDRISNLFKFPNSPKLASLPTPSHITSRMERIHQQRASRESRAQKKGQGRAPVSVK